MKSHINDLGGLVNKDMGFSKIKQELLYDSQNFRITANEDGTLAVRTNIKGNVNVVDIPTTPAQWEIRLVDPEIFVSGYTYTLVLDGENTINDVAGTLTWTFTYVSASQFYIDLAAQINAESTDPTSFLYFSAASVASDFSFIAVQGPLITFTVTSFNQTFPYPTVDVSSHITLDLSRPFLSNLKIIGWVALREDIILITTNGTFNPDDPLTGPFSSYGQIWRLTYDKSGNLASTSNYTLTLLYNDELNLTIYRPIANPGMIEARYENSAITPIYWTDNYNPPRRANVADPSLLTFAPEKLNLLPALSMDEPKLKEVVGTGNLRIGVYQFAYRLKNINGAESRFSRASKLIPIIDSPETGPYINYLPQSVYDPLTGLSSNIPFTAGQETGADANKSVKLSITNLDTNYDTIEIVSIYYDGITTLPECNIVKIDAVPASGYYESIVDSSSNDIPITLEELTAFNSSIIRCKTLATKFQTLFLGNIKIADQDVPFDARTYRFPANSTSTVIQNNGIDYLMDDSYQIYQIGANPVIPYDVPEDHDCIQDYDSQAPDSSLNNLYLPNSTVLGGEGPNIKYVFVTEDMLLDDEGLVQAPPFKKTSLSNLTIPGINGGTIEQVSTFQDNKSPYLYDALVGYRRDEMERFGIVFFDEFDNPSYVRWIGDIRLPHQFMPDTVTPGYPRTMLTASNYTATLPEGDINLPGGDKFKSTTATLELKSGSTTNTNLIGNILGIRITIKNFTGIPDNFKKAGIVRVSKTDADKHILGQGFVRPTFKNKGAAGDNNWVFTASPSRQGISYQSLDDTDGYIWPWYWTFTSPEFLFKSIDNLSYTSGDQLDIVGIARKSSMIVPDHYSFVYLRDSEGFEWNYKNGSDGDYDNFWGIVTKNYFIEETASTPNSIKNSSSLSNSGTYNIVYTTNLQNKFLQNGGYSNNPEVAYVAGGGTLSQVLTQDPVKTIYNCTVKNPTDPDWFPGNPNTLSAFSHCNETLFIQLDYGQSDYDFNLAVFGGLNFLKQDQMDHSIYGIAVGADANGMNGYIANYKRTISNQFGGNSYSARSFSEYISTNCIIDITDKTSSITTKVFGGDTTVAIMDYTPQFVDQSNMSQHSGGGIDILHWSLLFPCETSVAVDFRRNWGNTLWPSKKVSVTNRSQPSGAYEETNSYWDTNGLRPNSINFSELFNVSRVFNYTTDKRYLMYYPKPYLYIPVTEFDCRVVKSEKKIDGSIVDTWGTFKPSSFLDVESKYGPINNLIIFKDKLLYFQDRAFGQLQVNEQKLLSDASGNADLVLGASGILERYDYISTQTGTKHQFSMSVSDYSLIWFDVLARKMYKLSDGINAVSDLKGYHAYIYENTGGEIQKYDNPYIYKGVHSTYDYRFNEFYMTFLQEDKQFTLVYSDLFEGFVGEYTHYPVVYINDKSHIFSVPYSTLASNIYIHNYGDYGVFYGNPPAPSKISYVVNPEATIEKILTNFELSTEAFKTTPGFDQPDFYDFFDTMRIYDNYQNTDTLTLVPTLARKHKTIWNVSIPSDRVLDVTQSIFDPTNLSALRPAITKRMKDKWFVVDFTYNNTDNNKFVVHYSNALYSINSR